MRSARRGSSLVSGQHRANELRYRALRRNVAGLCQNGMYGQWGRPHSRIDRVHPCPSPAGRLQQPSASGNDDFVPIAGLPPAFCCEYGVRAAPTLGECSVKHSAYGYPDSFLGCVHRLCSARAARSF